MDQVLRRDAVENPQPHPAYDRGLCIILGLYGFFLPFSSAGTSLLLAAQLLMLTLAARRFWATQPWREPVITAGLLLLAWIVATTLLRDGWSGEARSVLSHYKELFFAPVIYGLFRLASQPDWFLRGLTVGALCYATAQWATLFSEDIYLALVFRRISASFVFDVLAFVLLQHARSSPRPWAWRAAAAYLALTVLFAMDARTGHVLLLALAAWATWVQVSGRWRLAAVVIVPLLAVGLALGSNTVQRRIDQTLESIRDPANAPNESTVIRLELLKHGITLAKEHAVMGVGYAHYAERHKEVVIRKYGDALDPRIRQFASAGWAATANPHNEFLMQVVGGGIASLALFVAWLLAPLASSGNRPRGTLGGLVIAFTVGCLFNSALMDFVEGHFYTALLMWVLARSAPRSAGP